MIDRTEQKYVKNKYMLTMKGVNTIMSLDTRLLKQTISQDALRNIIRFGGRFTKPILERLLEAPSIKNLKEFKQNIHFKLFIDMNKKDLEEVEKWKVHNLEIAEARENVRRLNKQKRGGRNKYE